MRGHLADPEFDEVIQLLRPRLEQFEHHEQPGVLLRFIRGAPEARRFLVGLEQ